MEWTFEFAGENLENLIELAVTAGPQHVTRDGKPAVVILSERDYRRLTGEQRSLKDFLLNGPDLTGVDLSRNSSPAREFDWG